MTYVHIYSPPVTLSALVTYCPTCERQRRMLSERAEWYGSTVTCSGCGDSWQDGERSERPFAPGWRKKSIEHARHKLASIGVVS